MLKMIDEKTYETSKITTQQTAQQTTQEKIFKIIKDTPSITQTQIATVLGLTRDGISYNIKQLKEKGIIKRIGATKNGMWKKFL